MDPRQIMIERCLREYLGTKEAKNLDKYGTPEHVLLIKLMGTISAYDRPQEVQNYEKHY